MDSPRTKKLEELRQKHPGKRLARATSQGKDYYVSAPTREQWFSFIESLDGGRKGMVALENLIKKCAVDPAAEQMDTLLDQKPGLADDILPAIKQLAGKDDKAEVELFD